MSTHHNQVISMGFTYLAHGTDPLLRQIAGEIITYQASEIGVMGAHLTQWGQVGTEADTAMGWMGMATPRDQMLGLATKAELRTLAAARGAQLNDVFTKLVITHHAGGSTWPSTRSSTLRLRPSSGGRPPWPTVNAARSPNSTAGESRTASAQLLSNSEAPQLSRFYMDVGGASRPRVWGP